MRNLTCFLLAAIICSPAHAQETSVADRVAKQNALFEEFYQAGLKNAPERATSVGDYRYNALLSDASLAQIARQHAENDAFLARLRAIPTTGMAETDRLSHELLERQLTRADVNYELKNYEMPINQQGGIHTSLADLPLSVPLDSVQHYEDYIARLHQIPRVLKQTTEVLRAGEKDGLMPPKLVVDQLAGQCEGIVAGPQECPGTSCCCCWGTSSRGQRSTQTVQFREDLIEPLAAKVRIRGYSAHVYNEARGVPNPEILVANAY
jgi:uncharacterized protein (DUF885 family)